MKHEHSLRSPCNNCPFRTDIEPYLRAARAYEIITGAERSELFCHKTLTHVLNGDDEDEDGPKILRGRSKVCAGMMICLEHVDRPTQMMRISERLGLYDRTKLDMDAPVYTSPKAFIEAHRRHEASARTRRKRRSQDG